MKFKLFASLLVAFALSAGLVACSVETQSYAQATLDEASGIKVEAENADSSNTATTDGAITVGANDVILISPFTEKGSFHLTITSEDGANTIYDNDVEGKVLFTIPAAPGTYDVTTSGNKVTGWMVVCAADQTDQAEQDAALAELLEQNGIDADLSPRS